MAHFGPHCDLRPIPAPPLKLRSDLNVKFSAHAGIIAKFCDSGKQHFAHDGGQSPRMATKTLNQVLGANLAAQMAKKGVSALALSRKAGVAPNTIGNYLRAGEPGAEKSVSPGSGKEKSAKLTEVEMLAGALGIEPVALLTDPDAAAEKARQIAQAVAQAMGVTDRDATKDEGTVPHFGLPEKRTGTGG